MKNEVRVYYFKKGFIWIGWIVVNRDQVSSYYDNLLSINVEPDSNIEYITFSFSRKKILNKLFKYINKFISEEKEE